MTLFEYAAETVVVLLRQSLTNIRIMFKMYHICIITIASGLTVRGFGVICEEDEYVL